MNSNKPTRLLDPRFKYIPAASTDIRKTIKRKKKELEQERIDREKAACSISYPFLVAGFDQDEKETSK